MTWRAISGRPYELALSTEILLNTLIKSHDRYSSGPRTVGEVIGVSPYLRPEVGWCKRCNLHVV
jgi:hypothetical protein